MNYSSSNKPLSASLSNKSADEIYQSFFYIKSIWTETNHKLETDTITELRSGERVEREGEKESAAGQQQLANDSAAPWGFKFRRDFTDWLNFPFLYMIIEMMTTSLKKNIFDNLIRPVIHNTALSGLSCEMH